MTDTATPATASPASASAARDRLAADLKVVIADTEELLRLVAGQAGDKATEVRARVEQNLVSARAELRRLQDQAMASARDTSQATDRYVHENPWHAVGIAACAGLVLGVLIGRR